MPSIVSFAIEIYRYCFERFPIKVPLLSFQTLCEKGLSAMESSHRRLICDMEEKHKLEIERLLAEKETALAEETQVGK